MRSSNLEHFWSLSVEEQFYFLWPLLLVRFYFRRTEIAVGGILLAAIARPLCFHHNVATWHWFPCVEDALAAGCLLAMIERDMHRVRRWIDRLIVPIVLGVFNLSNHHYPPCVQPGIIRTIVTLLIVCMIEHCVRKQYNFLNWKAVTYVGTLSYSLYLWHMPFAPEIPTHTWWTYFPVNLFLTTGCGLLSFYLAEKPFLRLRRKMASL